MLKRNFKLNIMFVMIAFSLFISFVVAFVDQAKLKKRVLEDYQIRMKLAEDTILTSLHTIDKAYHLLDGEIAKEMKINSDRLLAHYRSNPKVEQWDVEAFKDEFGMDVYIINDQNVIIHSSFEEDIGLDFSACCTTFSKVLDNRRKGQSFIDDGMDLQQKTGEIKKFSYVPTPDQKYVLQLGYSLEDEIVFQTFNVWNVIQELETTFDFIHKIRVRNSEGFVLREDIEKDMPANQLAVFNQALRSGVAQEIEGTWHNTLAKYRYVPYKAREERGISTHRVVEIIYHENEMQAALAAYKKEFIVQLLLILAAAIVIALIIFRWVAKPMHMAFHDCLTGLKNRSAFDEIVKERLERNDNRIALMMIDLDNFKTVNDNFGHSTGDELLKMVADVIRACVGKENISVRMGGDEFIVIFPNDDEGEVTRIASLLTEGTNRKISERLGAKFPDITLSIGIAFSDSGDNVDTLYQKADTALYASKNLGKNQYQVYTHR